MARTYAVRTSSPKPRRGRQLCFAYRPPTFSFNRCLLGTEKITILGWPSRGGAIVLDWATIVDFDFLGFDTTNPPTSRLDDPAAEDEFCQQLLQLGAKWFDSEERWRYIVDVTMGSGPSVSNYYDRDMPPPTPQEKKWFKVAWTEDRVGLWVLEHDLPMSYKSSHSLTRQEPGHAEPWYGPGKYMLARTMEERCRILEEMHATFFPSLAEYDGDADLKAWEEKLDGEIGPFFEAESVLPEEERLHARRLARVRDVEKQWESARGVSRFPSNAFTDLLRGWFNKITTL